MNIPPRYSRVAMLLHWAAALLILAGAGLGLTMTDLPLSPAKLRYYAWHKWIGITVFLVAALRLAWRAWVPPPPWPPAISPAQARAARAVHVLLYVLMLAIPVSGWLYSSATGISVSYLNLVPLPNLVPKDKALAGALLTVHQTLNADARGRAAAARRGSGQAPVDRSRRHAVAHAAAMMRLFAAALLAVSAAAGAQTVLYDKSEIRFVSRQMGVDVEGRFRRWKASVDFRPADPAQSRADFDVDLASIDLASEESEAEVRKADWFDTARFPVASFRSTALRALGGDRYEVTGKLAMKGVTRDIVVPVEIRKDAAGNTVAEARFAVKRLPYRIGDGPWSDPSVVADDIAVRARVVLGK